MNLLQGKGGAGSQEAMFPLATAVNQSAVTPAYLAQQGNDIFTYNPNETSGLRVGDWAGL
jgi:hypothetical protein